MTKGPRYVVPKGLARWLEPDDAGLPLIVDAEQGGQYLGVKDAEGFLAVARGYDDFPKPIRIGARNRGALWYRPHLDEWRKFHPRRRRNDGEG